MSIKLSNTEGLNVMQRATVARSDVQWALVKEQGWQCCFNCENFLIKPGVCTLHNRETPPPQVILLGCKDHMCDIPF